MTVSPFDRAAEWAALADDDARARAATGAAGVTFAVSGDRQRVVVRADGRGVRRADGRPAFTLAASDEAWSRFFEAEPVPFFHHFLAMRMRVPGTRVDGEELAYAQHARLAHRFLALGRELLHGEPKTDPAPAIDRSGIRGGYVRVRVGGSPVDLHVSRAGAGVPLLVLHTAGADSRQAHALMSDPDLTRTHEVVAFDLPGHGSSGTLPGPLGSWSLTTDLYGDVVLAVIEALGLERPVLLGASMAGEICLELAYRAPDRLGGVIACEAAELVPGRTTRWARDPRVDSAAFVPEWIAGLIGPRSPTTCRDDILWTYSQGGLGTFAGDIDFYSGDWDGREKVGRIDTARCPVVMMTGDHDYSCTPEMSRATAARIPGAEFWTMPGLGHFPVCEHPDAFAPHLRRALTLIGEDA
ncbi:alpha/beta hydrolase [Isoptericola cucumis]|uniref:alpha/beta fold hydrolase n=1 Tax=Isoptericola cucumis TaxID=1776856 RepID=UPI003207FEB8